METFLNRNGFDTVTATDGKTGIALIRNEQPDLILLNVMMETLLSRFEVCRAVQSDPALEQPPLSSASRELEKPVDKELLLVKIDHVVSKVTARPGSQRH